VYVRKSIATSAFVAVLLFSALAVAFNIHPASAQLPSGNYKWVAITKQDWVSIVQPLADVRTSKGLPAYVASVEWIYANFPGSDKPEQIRNFMKQAYDSWGVQYLLIAGDVLAVPTHYEYQQDYRLNTRLANQRPTDWYYGCFDKPKVVAVGRMPAMNAADLQVMVRKTVNYELNPPEGDWKRTAINAWGQPEYTDPAEREREEKLFQAFVTQARRYLSGFNQIEYAMPDNPLQPLDQNLAAMLNDGASVLWITAHGSPLNVGSLTADTARALRNGLKLPIVIAESCGAALFDTPQCYSPPFNNTYVSLELLRNPSGGCVAFIGNTGGGTTGLPDYFLKFFFKDYRPGTWVAMEVLLSIPPDVVPSTVPTILGDPAVQWVANQYGSTITLQVPSRVETTDPDGFADILVTGRIDPPVAGATIEIMSIGKTEETPLYLYGNSVTLTTNADGSFQCTRPSLLPLGTYFFSAWWPGGDGRVGACGQSATTEVVPAPTPTPTEDFTISVSPSNVTIMEGRGSANVLITSINGFSSPVSLRLSGPTTVTGTFDPASVTPPPGGSAASTLTLIESESAKAGGLLGSCAVWVIATSGSLSHEVDITVTFQAAATPTPRGPRCIIATAAYGSEFAPEIVYMRYVRDGLIGSSTVGRAIVDRWNSFYYSWSPPIADFISNSQGLRAFFRALLLPLVGIVHVAAQVFNAVAPFNMDFASATAFALSAFMCIVVYIAIPAKVLYAVLKKAFSFVSQPFT
jgi:hypothetical protein